MMLKGIALAIANKLHCEDVYTKLKDIYSLPIMPVPLRTLNTISTVSHESSVMVAQKLLFIALHFIRCKIMKLARLGKRCTKFLV